MAGWGQGKGVCTGTVCRPEQEPHTGRTVVREGPVLSSLSPSQTMPAMLFRGTMPHTLHSSGRSLPVPSLCTPTVCAVTTRFLLFSSLSVAAAESHPGAQWTVVEVVEEWEPPQLYSGVPQQE